MKNETTRVAFLGLGAMGAPMCSNLLKAGFPLTVWNRTRTRAEELGRQGARVAGSPKEAADGADVVMICVPSSPEVRDVITREPDSVLAGIRRGATIIDCSTIDPNASREMHALCQEAGVDFLEAPLSGGTGGAVSGTLTMMVGGDAAVLERVRPVMEAVGKNIFHLGGPGAGQTTKLCNNLIYAAQVIGVSEAFAMVMAAGIDPKLVTDVLLVSTANCTAVQQRVPVPGVQPSGPASNDWKPGFATEWMAKDLHLAQEFAKSLGVPVMQTALDHQLMRMAIQAGYAKLDLSVVGKMMQDWNARAGEQRDGAGGGDGQRGTGEPAAAASASRRA